MTVSARAGGGLDTDAGGGSAAVVNTGAGKKTEKKNLLDGRRRHAEPGLIIFVARDCLRGRGAGPVIVVVGSQGCGHIAIVAGMVLMAIVDAGDGVVVLDGAEGWDGRYPWVLREKMLVVFARRGVLTSSPLAIRPVFVPSPSLLSLSLSWSTHVLEVVVRPCLHPRGRGRWTTLGVSAIVDDNRGAGISPGHR